MVNHKKKSEIRNQKSARRRDDSVSRLKDRCIFWDPSQGFDIEYNLKKGEWVIYFDLINLTEKLSTKINLVEKGSMVKIFGLFSGSDDKNINWDLRVTHIKSQTSANVLIKGILTDQAKTQFDGTLIVQPELSEVESILRHHTLLLSDDAQAVITPALEINSDDAKITHASSISNLDEDQLFYLYSRNYSHQEATRILVEGFLKEVKS